MLNKEFIQILSKLEEVLLSGGSTVENYTAMIKECQTYLIAYKDRLAESGRSPEFQEVDFRHKHKIMYKTAMHCIVKTSRLELALALYKIFGEEFLACAGYVTSFELSWFGISLGIYQGDFLIALSKALTIENEIQPVAKLMINLCHQLEAIDMPKDEGIKRKEISSGIHIFARSITKIPDQQIPELIKAITAIYDDKLPIVLDSYYDQKGYLPMHYLIDYIISDSSLVQAENFFHIMQQFRQKDWSSVTKSGDTVLHLLIRSGIANEKNIIFLISALQINITIRNSDNETALELAAKYCSVKVFEIFLAAIPLTIKAQEVQYVLHAAAKVGRVDIIKLMQHHYSSLALIQIPDCMGYRPIHYAAMHGHHELLEMLRIDASLMTNTLTGETPFHVAAQFQQAEVIKHFISWGHEAIDRNAQTKLGYTAFHLAIVFHKSDYKWQVANLLIDNVDININTAEQETALHLCARQTRSPVGLRSLMNKLYTKAPDMLKAVTCRGWTPLHVAACYDIMGTGAFAYLRELDRSVAYLVLADIQGNTAAHLAKMTGNNNTYAILAPKTTASRYKNKQGLTHEQVLLDSTLKREIAFLGGHGSRMCTDYSEAVTAALFFNSTQALGDVSLFSSTPPLKIDGESKAESLARQKPYYIAQLKTFKKQTKEHFVRLFESTFYIFVAYWKQNVGSISRENTHMFQHGVANKSGYHAAHDSGILQRLNDDEGVRTARRFVVNCETMSHLEEVIVQKGILDGTHFLDSLNATTAVPRGVNDFDNRISRQSWAEPCLRDMMLELLHEVSKGQKNPINAYKAFLKHIKDKIIPNAEVAYTSKRPSATLPTEVRKMIVSLLTEAHTECEKDDYRHWLRLNDTDDYILFESSFDKKEKLMMVRLRLYQLQDEILFSPSEYIKSLNLKTLTERLQQQQERLDAIQAVQGSKPVSPEDMDGLGGKFGGMKISQ